LLVVITWLSNAELLFRSGVNLNSRLLTYPSPRRKSSESFFCDHLMNRFEGENNDGDTSVWRDAKHHTRDACAPFFNFIVTAKSGC
jgi:hypothetical protein